MSITETVSLSWASLIIHRALSSNHAWRTISWSSLRCAWCAFQTSNQLQVKSWRYLCLSLAMDVGHHDLDIGKCYHISSGNPQDHVIPDASAKIYLCMYIYIYISTWRTGSDTFSGQAENGSKWSLSMPGHLRSDWGQFGPCPPAWMPVKACQVTRRPPMRCRPTTAACSYCSDNTDRSSGLEMCCFGNISAAKLQINVIKTCSGGQRSAVCTMSNKRDRYKVRFRQSATQTLIKSRAALWSGYEISLRGRLGQTGLMRQSVMSHRLEKCKIIVYNKSWWHHDV